MQDIESTQQHNDNVLYYRNLLARRLDARSLKRAINIVKDSLVEFGGGIARVEQRLPSILEWCRLNDNSRLVLNSSSKEISNDHFCKPQALKGSAYSHHKDHLQRVIAVTAELRFSRDERKALISNVSALVENARKIELSNTSKKLDRKKPLPYERNLVASDAKRRSEAAKKIRHDVFRDFNALMQNGWIVDAFTITLPSAFHSSTSPYFFGLAGSPGWDTAANLLRSIRSNADIKGMITFWRIEVHSKEFDTLHMHMVCAYPDQVIRSKHHEHLRQQYECLTYRYQNLKVRGCISIGTNNEYDEWDHSRGPLYIDLINDELHLQKTINYISAGLKPLVHIVPGRSYGRTGKLTFALKENPKTELIKDNRIKIYQEEVSCSKLELCTSEKPTGFWVFGWFHAFFTTRGGRRFFWPIIRAPPTHFNLFHR